jgi:hypothetical protein
MTEIKQFYKAKNLFANNNIPTMQDILEDIAQYRLAKEQRKQARQQNRPDTKRKVNEPLVGNYYYNKQHRQYILVNNEHRVQPYICECGSTINKKGKPQHMKTVKHINYSQSL